MAVGTASKCNKRKASVRLFRMGVWVYVWELKGNWILEGLLGQARALRALGSEM